MIKLHTKSIKEVWVKSRVVDLYRKLLEPLIIDDGSCDPQDLEHQCLFRLLSSEILVENVVKEQKNIVLERMEKAIVKPKDIFCFGKRNDKEWVLKWDNRKLYATQDDRKKEIIFREITLRKERELCKNIIDNYHYIHCDRCDNEKGLMFGFFLNGSTLPFAIEQIEPCSIARNYKKAILMLLDINYHTTVELTRFYSVPNSPKNLISVLDSMVGDALKDRGYEWMMTAMMPAFAKTKSSTTAGGIDTPIFAKPTGMEFFQRHDGAYELCVPRKKAKLNGEHIIKMDDGFTTIEMIKSLKGMESKIEEDKIYYIEK